MVKSHGHREEEQKRVVPQENKAFKKKSWTRGVWNVEKWKKTGSEKTLCLREILGNLGEKFSAKVLNTKASSIFPPVQNKLRYLYMATRTQNRASQPGVRNCSNKYSDIDPPRMVLEGQDGPRDSWATSTPILLSWCTTFSTGVLMWKESGAEKRSCATVHCCCSPHLHVWVEPSLLLGSL